MAPAEEVAVLSAVGMRQVMLDLGPKFEREAGRTLAITFDAFGLIVRRVEGGESVDVVMIPRAGLVRLIETGRVVAGSEAELASSIAGVAVRKGAPIPDISSAEAFRRALLDAKSIARPDPAVGGSSGDHIVKVLDRLGIAKDVDSKSVWAGRPGEVGATPGQTVAEGRAEIALHQVQELLAVPGLEMVGPFPADLQGTFVFCAGVMTGARNAGGAKALIDFVRTPDAKAVIKAKGMKPAIP